MSKRSRNERPANLIFWLADGACGAFRARVKADAEVSIGRTDSKRGLGFIVTQGDQSLDFVLDKDQVIELAIFLHMQRGRLREPLGRKKNQLSWKAWAVENLCHCGERLNSECKCN